MTIRVRRRATERGYHWFVEDWDGYLKWLATRGVPPPPQRYGVTIAYETAADAGYLRDLDALVLQLFHLVPESAEVVSD